MASRRPGRTIDYKSWAAIPGLVDEILASETGSAGGLAFTEPATILRCRGYVKAMFDESMQVGDIIILAFALAIVSTDAFGVASGGGLPDPIAEPEYSWLWWGEIRLDAFTAAGENAWGTSAQLLEVDTKAMRKIKPRETLTMVFEVGTIAGAPVTYIDIGQTRVLIGT